MFSLLFFWFDVNNWDDTELIVAVVLENKDMYVNRLEDLNGKNFEMKTDWYFDEFVMKVNKSKDWVK